MKVYIAGAITGVSDYAERFGQAEERLKKAGHVVLNPAKLPAGMSKADYMRICLAMIDSADIVYLLPGANLSKGAAVERDTASTSASPSPYRTGCCGASIRWSGNRRMIWKRIRSRSWRKPCAT